MKKLFLFSSLALALTLALTLTLVSPAFAEFSDVATTHTNSEAIEYLRTQNIVSGYPDGTYQPNKTINRAEFLKVVIGSSRLTPSVDEYKNCFPDVKEEWFAPYVCYAKQYNIISGYPDGSFRPANSINLVEASKMLVNVLKVSASDLGTSWYDPFINSLSAGNYIPDSFQWLEQRVTRGEMAELTWRILEEIKNRPARSAEELRHPSCQALGEDLPESIDMNRVRETWLSWNNTERSKLGKAPYVYNSQLNRTATAWSNYSASIGVLAHKRHGQTAYYDYNIITNWFRDQGLTFKNLHGVTYSENIGRGYVSCGTADCTDKVIQNIRGTFDFFMNEKNKAYKPHYESVMNDYFKEIGLGLALTTNGQYYLTVHYGTEITSEPLPVCE